MIFRRQSLLLLMFTLPIFATAQIVSDEVPVDRVPIRSWLQNALNNLSNHPEINKSVLDKYPRTAELIKKELQFLDTVSFHIADNEQACQSTGSPQGSGWKIVIVDGPGRPAYVHLNELRSDGINICPAYFKATDTDQIQIVIHELAHFVGVDEEDVADSVSITAAFLNFQASNVTDYVWEFPKLTSLWQELYIWSFKPTFFEKEGALSEMTLKTPTDLYNSLENHKIKHRIFLNTTEKRMGYSLYCAIASSLTEPDGKGDGGENVVSVPYPNDQVQLKVYQLRTGISASNTMVGLSNHELHIQFYCITSAPILSREMILNLIKSHMLAGPK